MLMFMLRLSNGCVLEAKQVHCFTCDPDEERTVLVLTFTVSLVLCTANLQYHIKAAGILRTEQV